MKQFKWFLLISAALLLAFTGCNKNQKSQQQNKANVATANKKAPVKKIENNTRKAVQKKTAQQNVPAGDKVKVELYVMSHCPFGVRVLDTFADVVKKAGNYIDLKINYIGNDLGNGKFKSMHGDKEVQGDILELCTMKYASAGYKYFPFFKCMDKNSRNLPDGWETCAKANGITNPKIKTCFEGAEGKALLAASFKAAQTRRATGSPTIYMNNKKYMSGRATSDFLREICKNLKTKPQFCSTLPKPLQFTIYALSDKRCKECTTRVNRLLGQIKGMFPGAIVKNLDYKNADGKKLYDETKIKFLPAFLFEDKVKGDPGYSRLQRWLTPAGKYLNLRLGSKFDPSAEICDNKIDDTGNGKIDCADPTCKNTLSCRKEIKKKVEVFVMAGCPYGTKALNAVKEVKNAFKKDGLTFEVHYIASKTAKGFNSLHGPWEVEEDKRELCARKMNDTKGWEYIWCRNKNIRDKNWEPCAKQAKLDVAKMKKCSTGDEGTKLLAEDIKIAQALSIGASPTWLANNKYKFSGIAAKAIQSNICKYNKGLKGCKATLSNDTKVKGSCGH